MDLRRRSSTPPWPAPGPPRQAKAVTLRRFVEPFPASHGDADRLQQVVWNLLSNAIKFTPRGGDVTVRAFQSATTRKSRCATPGSASSPISCPSCSTVSGSPTARSPAPTVGWGWACPSRGISLEMHGGTISAASAGEGHGSRVRGVAARLVKRVTSRGECRWNGRRPDEPRRTISLPKACQRRDCPCWKTCGCSSSTMSRIRAMSSCAC